MTRRLFAPLALAVLLALSFMPTPASAAYIVMCAFQRPGVSPGPGRYVSQGSGNTYQLDKEGCAPILATDVGQATADGFTQVGAARAIILSGATAQAQIGVLPASGYITAIVVQNQGANAPTGGGLKFGSTAGGTDIVTGMLATGNNGINIASDVSLAKRAFNSTSATALWVDAVTSWNSSTVIVTVLYTFF